LQTIQRIRLQKEIQDMVCAFDEALRKLRMEKLSLQVDVKAAEVHLLVMWQEYMHLVEFSKKDEILASKLAEKHQEQKVL
jgi:hypothetical protein